MIVAARAFVTVRASAHRPKKQARPKIKAKDIKKAIDHAKLLCFNFEDTIECRLAWEDVEELSSAYHDQWLYEMRMGLRQAADALDEDRRLAAPQREYDL